MVEMLKGIPLLIQQFKALLKKNVLLSWRNKRATFIQLFSSIFFMILLVVIEISMKSRYSDTTMYENVYDPKPLIAPPIPPCETKFYIKQPCYDFIWSGNGSPKIQSIVKNIMANNPGRPIPDHKVKSFATKEEVDDWLFSDPMHCPGALHFVERSSTVISYGIQTNSTAVAKRGKNEDPTFKFQVPLQIAAEREIARFLLQAPNFSWQVGIKEFAHPVLETYSDMQSIGPIFFLVICMFSFVLQIGSLITEKELKLRQAMSIMGLYETAYWLSWLTWETVIIFLSSLFIVLFGMMFRFNLFLHNSFGVLFFVFFLFQFTMISFAFLISTLFTKASSATTVGFSVFVVSFLTQMVAITGFPYNGDEKDKKIYWSLFPPNLFSAAINILIDATLTPEDKGISWSNRGNCRPTQPSCGITIAGLYKWFIGDFFIWFLLALYFDNIIPNASGVRKSIFYFLNPGYWTGRGGGKVEERGLFSWASSIPQLEYIPPDDEDVREEENIVKQQMNENANDPNIAVQIRGLAKTYPGTIKMSGCCKCSRTTPYHAVKGIWMNFAKNQLFCLLGPNGAGKTTTINCLIGNIPVTGGDALVYGDSVRSSVGMSNIRRLIGVCPQFDILWAELSCKEHLNLFASIKGMPSASINSVVDQLLAKVKLSYAAKTRAGSCSGGMKRRLSVATALIGDPKLIVLDEPTTGMDPVTRRHVWDVIEDAKKGRAIILTTHSMEEADILGDRIGIVAKGRLRCIGTSIRLKSRFGTGFITTVSFIESISRQTPVNADASATTGPHHLAVKKFFKHHLDVEPKEENNSFVTFVIPHEKEGQLTRFFAELQDREEEFGILDIQLGLTTLEDVFLNIAKQAELESAMAEGSFITLTFPSGHSLQIPKGARFVGIPGTESATNPRGIMVEVYWEQDDTGALSISGHSSELPVPPNARTIASTATPLQRANLGMPGRVFGIVIDPKDIEG